MTTSNDPDQIRADIERTRATLSDDVDDLAESVKPKNVAGRQVGKVKEAASNLKDRVMGSDDDEGHSTKDAIADRPTGPRTPSQTGRTQRKMQSPIRLTRPRRP